LSGFIVRIISQNDRKHNALHQKCGLALQWFTPNNHKKFPDEKSYDSIAKIVRLTYNIAEPDLVEKEESTMSITATELKQNLSKYLLMAEREDIFITRNGKVVAKLSNPFQDRVDTAKSLFGIIPGDMTVEQAHGERLDRV
jgi:antitoxin (DNA-binding transcriptional repressor) of toxin-antitoxin stability system